MPDLEDALYLLTANHEVGPAFLDSAVRALTLGLGWRWAGVALLNETGQRSHAIVFYERQFQRPRFSCSVLNAPCKQVYLSPPGEPHHFQTVTGNYFCEYPLPDNLRHLSFRGEAFYDQSGAAIGHVFALDDRPRLDNSEERTFFSLVSQRIGSEYKRWLSEEKRYQYAAILSKSSEMMALFDRAYQHLAANQLYIDNFWDCQDDIVGQSLAEVYGCQFFDQIKEPLDRCLAGEYIKLEEWPNPKAPESSFFDITLTPFRNREDQITGAIFSLRDVTDIHQLSAQIVYHANHDADTGLLNRTAFERRIDRILKRSRSNKVSYTLCWLNLGQLDDTHIITGEKFTAQLLRQIAKRLAIELRDVDTLARVGDLEFGLILENCGFNEARCTVQRLIDVLSGRTISGRGEPFAINASAGLVKIMGTESKNQLLSNANIACYAARQRGPNLIHTYGAQDGEIEELKGELLLVAELREAVSEDRFRLLFQPIMPLARNGESQLHYEALLRLKSRDGKELISPDAFIPAAERHHLMDLIDRWVVRTVLASYRKLFARSPATKISINLSGNSFDDQALPDFIRQCLFDSKVPPSAVCFEITETAAISNLGQAAEFINELRQLGCRFALDDFGSGVSSFGYLKSLPVDYVKIDSSFVTSMQDDMVDYAIVNAITKIGHSMDIGIIAEGAEVQATVDCLRELQVDYVQGFIVGKPALLHSDSARYAASN